MKKLLLSILFVGVAALANAQKSEVAEAKRLWGIFQFSMMVDPNAPKMKLPQDKVRTGPASTAGFNGDGKADSKVNRTQAAKGSGPISTTKGTDAPKLSFIDRQITSLKEGISHTDLAILHEKTKNTPEPYVYKALFASQIALVDTIDVQNALANQKIAEEAITKAISLDTKNAEKENIELAKVNIRNAISGRGIRAYNGKDYKTALASFKELLVINPNDTAMYLNSGVVAKLDNNYPEAIKNFKKMIEFNGPDAKNYYSEIIGITLANLKDTTAGLGLIKEALAKYPTDGDFIAAETDIYITKGDISKSRESLAKLISNNPKNALYQYLLGNTYFNSALHVQKERDKLDVKKVKEYNAETLKVVALIDQSIPYYKKALEIDPNHEPTLDILTKIYAFKSDTKSYDEIKKRLDALPAKN